MKKISRILLAVATGLALVSCNDLLNIDQHGVIPTSGFYDTDEGTTEAITALYDQFSQNLTDFYGRSPIRLKELLSDDVYSGGGVRNDNVNQERLNEYQFDYTNTLIANAYKGLYEVIYKANLILNNVEDNSAIKKQAINEAKVFRALSYIDLVTLWGTPPLVKEAVRDDYKAPNSTPAEIWSLIEQDLTEALDSKTLAQKKSVDDKLTGIRITTQFTQALLGKAYVYEGKYAEALPLLESVIKSGLYDFLDNYGNYSVAAYNNNSEILFSNYVLDDSSRGTSTGIYPWTCIGLSSNFLNGVYTNTLDYGTGGFNFLPPSQSIIAAFKANEPDSKRFKQTFKSYSDLLSGGLSLKEGLTYYANCGYWNYKYRPARSSMTTNGWGYAYYTNVSVMKLSEVVLLAAECAIRTKGAGAGDTYINMIRTKAGVPAKTGCTLEDLKLEKRLECYMDGTRYYDLVRWGDAAKALADQGKEVMGFSLDANGNEVVKAQFTNSSYGWKSGKHDLLPFPEEEMNVNPNMKQNKGWE